ncbi:MAG: glycosyltransferase [Candidatus Rokubacteria bacterium]|nr:glycosyltransferase [Candidatus Rokubacteria bacterium]
MKVAMVETGGWGGIAHYAWNLSRALSEAGAQVVLLTNVRYELGALPSPFRIERCFAKGVSYPRASFRLLRTLRALGPDVVHVQSLLSTRFDAFLWPLVRGPLVVTAHNVRSHENDAWENWTLWRCLRTADAVVIHTQEGAAELGRRLGAGPRIEVIHHGDYAFFDAGQVPDRAAARRRLELPLAAPLILAFGAIRPYKGILQAIAALPRVRRHHPHARLVIAGPLLHGQEEEYHDAIRHAAVPDGVIFRPAYVPHAEVAFYFRAADVAVYNYTDVTDSGALRIAASLGTPVVATAVGGFREFLTDGVTGRLVPPDAPEALASAVSDLLADPVGAARMADAARALAASAWSWADSAAATLALYRGLARGAGSVAGEPAPGGAVRGTPQRGRPALSVVLITRNEAHRIRRSLESVRWADELIVVDGQSTDGTAEIALDYGAKVHSREMRGGFGEQKNFAIAQASKSWILSLDADEEVTPALRFAIERALADPGDCLGFRMPRLTSYLGRFIRHCGWYPRPVLRLFRRGDGRFTDSLVHEEVVVDGPVGDLREDLLHRSYESLADHVRKLDLYTSYDARMLADRGVRVTGLTAPWFLGARPLLAFFEKYVLQRGFLEGPQGFILSAMAALVVFVNYAKLWEIERRPGGAGPGREA